MIKTAIIIGASHGGSQAAVSLRQSGWEGSIILIGDESDLPYHRPPLSKDYLSGQKSLNDIVIRSLELYEKANITLKLGRRVIEINRAEKSIKTDAGDVFWYDKLILATGARVREIPIPGADNDKVFYLRDAQHVRAIIDQVTAGKRVVIIGGGYIGLETAASLKKQGMEVTVLEAMDRILQRVTAPILSDFYRRVHTEEGVDILENVTASEIQKDDQALRVLTSCDKALSADIVIIGIGVIPNTELAQAAGLVLGNGIEVNEFCQTSDPDIYAAGDVTWHYNPIYETYIRLESVPNATEQSKVIAAHINGVPKPYHSLPWFWSDQFDLKLQIAGLSTGYDDVIIRGDIETGRSFAAYYFKNGQFIAVDAVNAPRDFMFGKMSLTKGVNLAKRRIGNAGFELKACVSDV